LILFTGIRFVLLSR